MRLQKYMAMCGVAARRKCEEIIAAGRVAVNGETITQMGTQVEDGDVVTLDGRIITPEEEKAVHPLSQTGGRGHDRQRRQGARNGDGSLRGFSRPPLPGRAAGL